MPDLRVLQNARDLATLVGEAQNLGLSRHLTRPLSDLQPHVPRDKAKWFETMLLAAPATEPKTIGSVATGRWIERWMRGVPGATHWVPLALRHFFLDLLEPEPGPSSGVPPADVAALNAWAEARGVADELVAMVRVSTGPSDVMWTYSAARINYRDLLLGQTKIFETLSADLGRYTVRRAQAEAWRSLEKLGKARRDLRDAEIQSMAADVAPSDAGAHALFTWLRAAHAHVRERFPPDTAATGTTTLSVLSLSPPVVRVSRREDWAGTHVDLLVGADDPRDLRVSCSICGGGGGFEAHDPCLHTAEPLRAAASAVAREHETTFAPLLTALARPSWERFLEEAFDRAPSPAAEDRAIGFRILPAERGGLTLELLQVTRTSKGAAKTKKLGQELVGAFLDSKDTPPAVKGAIDLLLVDYAAQGEAGWARWHPRATTAHQALLALVDYPMMFSKPERADVPVQVRLAQPKLRVERDASGRTTFGARFGSEARPLHDFIASLKANTYGNVHAHLDVLAGVCKVGRVSTDLIRLAARLDLGTLRAPPEATESLLRRLEPLEARGLIERDAEVKGPCLPADESLIWRLIPDSDMRLVVELRVRPIAQGPSFPAGDGPEEVYGRDAADRIFHAMRALAREAGAARLLASTAPLPPLESPPFRWAISHDDAADFLVWLEAHPEEARVEWERTPWRLTRPTTSKDLKLRIRKERDWFNMTGGLDVDGVRVDLAVLLEAARAERRFVLVGADHWVPLSQELRERIERLGDFTSTSKRGVELNPLAVPVVRDLDAEGAVDAEPAWLELQANFARADALVPELPTDLLAELRPYQREGFEWMARLSAWGVGACLADDMGLGKTLQALAIVLARSTSGPTLVVAPTSVCFNWHREAARFAPGLKTRVYAEVPRAERGVLVADAAARDVVIVSYGMLLQDRVAFTAKRWTTLVLDEAQAIKNSETQRAQAVRGLDVEWAVGLSGTPIENHLGELWSLMRRLVPGLLGTQEFFRQRYALPIERKDPGVARGLARMITPFVLRRTKAEVATDLPPRTDILVEVELEPRHLQLYEDARIAAAAQIAIPTSGPEREQSRFQMLAALTRLRQLACHPRLVEPESPLGSAKMARLLELLGTLVEEGHQALVFSQFVRHLDLVEPELAAAGIPSVRLDGSTSAIERGRRVDTFQSGQAKVFLLSLKAGGTGLNLTAADYVFHLDPWWNPAAEDQATDRAHRIGQERPVTVYRLISRGTVEAQILRMHEEKRELVESLLAGTDSAGKMSLEELAELVRSGHRDDETETAREDFAERLGREEAPEAEERPAEADDDTGPIEVPRSTFVNLSEDFAEFMEGEPDLFDIGPVELAVWRSVLDGFAAFADGSRADPHATDLEAVQAAFLDTLPKTRRRAAAVPVAAFVEFVGALRNVIAPDTSGSSAALDRP